MAPKHQTRVQGIFFNLSVVSIWFSGILLLELIPGWLILMLKFVHCDLLFLVTREETETPKLQFDSWPGSTQEMPNIKIVELNSVFMV